MPQKKRKRKNRPKTPTPPGMTRQRVWQMRRVEEGRCMSCGQKRNLYSMVCDLCAEVRRLRYQAVRALKRQRLTDAQKAAESAERAQLQQLKKKYETGNQAEP